MNIFAMFIYSVIAAFLAAKLEIHIEGEDGWAKSLPTWQKKNMVTKIFFGDAPMTGYHFWFTTFVIISFQTAFFVAIPFSLSLELQGFAMMCFTILLEDLFWFMLNPRFGLQKFNKVDAHWHKEWTGAVPTMYPRMLFFTLLFYVLSLYI